MFRKVWEVSRASIKIIFENTAHTYQVLAQRQDLTDERFIADKSYPPFTMEEELFEETYIMYGTKGT